MHDYFCRTHVVPHAAAPLSPAATHPHSAAIGLSRTVSTLYPVTCMHAPFLYTTITYAYGTAHCCYLSRPPPPLARNATITNTARLRLPLPPHPHSLLRASPRLLLPLLLLPRPHPPLCDGAAAPSRLCCRTPRAPPRLPQGAPSLLPLCCVLLRPRKVVRVPLRELGWTAYKRSHHAAESRRLPASRRHHYPRLNSPTEGAAMHVHARKAARQSTNTGCAVVDAEQGVRYCTSLSSGLSRSPSPRLKEVLKSQ